ncbi:MAG: TonB-dependent receptor [Pseudomonadota bacterium]
MAAVLLVTPSKAALTRDAVFKTTPVGLVSPAVAASQQKSFDIPPQKLDEALVAFGVQSGLQVSFETSEVRGLTGRSVSGNLPPREALRKIIEGSGLEADFVGSSGVVVFRRNLEVAQSNGEISLDTIVVQGERVERSVFNTPSSVFVTTGEDLEQRPDVEEIEEVFKTTPNLVTVGTSNSGPVVRGQNSTGPLGGALAGIAGTLPRMTTTVDGRPLAYNEFIFGQTSVWDTDAVEVFLGPQTTAQGANSIAGGIYVRTKDPTFDPEFKARVKGGTFNTRGLSAALSGPVFSDELAARFSVDYQDRDTFINFTNPAFLATSLNPFEVKQLTLRGKLLWEPKAIPGFSTKLTLSRAQSSLPQNESVNEPFSQLNNPFGSAEFKNKNYSLVHDISYAFNEYLKFSNRFSISDFRTDRTADVISPQTFELRGTDIVNETIASFKAMDGRLTGVVGVYLRDIDQDEDGSIQQGPLTLTQVFKDKKESLGVFGEATFQVTDKLDVTAGLRYQRDKQTRTGPFVLPIIPPAFPFVQTLNLNFNGTFDAILPKFAIGYNVTEDVRVGAIVSKGYNPGGIVFDFRSLVAPTAPFVPFSEETVWNYEIYTRARLLQNRLKLQGNVFFADHKDAQRTESFATGIPILPFAAVVQNVERAASYGAEISADFQANDIVRVHGALGLLHTEITKSTNASAPKGNEFTFSPSVTVSGGVDLTPVDGLTLSAFVRHTDSYFSDSLNTQPFFINAFTLVDFKALYQVTDNFQIFGFVNNAFDEIAPTAINVAGPPRLGIVTKPREFGIGGSVALQ